MTAEDLNNHKLTPTSFQMDNMIILANLITQLETAMGRSFTVNSGLRSIQIQNQVNPGAKNSAHLSGEAVDVADVDGTIYAFCMAHVDLLIRLGLYVESKTYTPRWTHLQSRATKSGNRFFIP